MGISRSIKRKNKKENNNAVKGITKAWSESKEKHIENVKAIENTIEIIDNFEQEVKTALKGTVDDFNELATRVNAITDRITHVEDIYGFNKGKITQDFVIDAHSITQDIVTLSMDRLAAFETIIETLTPVSGEITPPETSEGV